MSKCRVDGCNRSKDLGPDGFCKVCVLASEMRGPGSSLPSSIPQSTLSQAALASADTANPLPSSVNMSTTTTGGLDFTKIDLMAKKISDGETVDQNELMKGVFGLIYGVAKSMGTVDQIKSDVKSNTGRIEALEARVEAKDEVSLVLGLVILNLPPPPTEVSELEYARAVIKEIKAPGVDPSVNITKAFRIGYKAKSKPGANDGKPGRLEVEVTDTDVKAKIMKTRIR